MKKLQKSETRKQHYKYDELKVTECRPAR